MPDNASPTVIRANLQRINGEDRLFEIALDHSSSLVTWKRVSPSPGSSRVAYRHDLRRALDRCREIGVSPSTAGQLVAYLLDQLGLLSESTPAPSYSNVGTFIWHGTTYNIPVARTQTTARIITTNTTNTTNPWAS